MKIIARLYKSIKNVNPVISVVSVTCFLISIALIALTAVFNLHPFILHVAFFFMILNASYVIYLTVLGVKKLRVRFYDFAESRPFLNRMARDYGYRTMIFSSGTFLLNAAYTLFNILYGLIFKQLWNCALGVFYFVLSLNRLFVVAKTVKVRTMKDKTAEEQEAAKLGIYRLTGIMLLVLTAALNGVILIMIRYHFHFRYYGLLIVVAAIFAVCKMVMAIYNLIKVSGLKDYAAHAARNINFASALVSLLALQTAVLASFPMSGNENAVWNAQFGTHICIVIAGIGIAMIIKSCVKLKKLRKPPTDENTPSD